MSNRNIKKQLNSRLFMKPWVAGLVTFFLLSSVSLYIISQRYNIEKSHERRAAENMAESAADRLQQSLQYSLSATEALAMTIGKNGLPGNFDSVAAYILKNNKYIDVLSLVPAGVVKYIYPLKGNEASLGLNLFEDSARNKEAFKTFLKRELYFAGPYKLRRSDMGICVVGRLPVFKDDKFWGFTSVTIRLVTLLQAAGIDTTGKNGYYFELSKINPNTGKEEYFLPLRKFSPDQYKVAVSVPNGEWKLSVIPVNGYKSFEAIIPVSLLAFILCALGSLFAAYVSRTPARLHQLVRERTEELEKSAGEAKRAEQLIRESEVKYRTLVEQATDGIFIADFKGNFAVVNPAGCKLSQYTETELLGMRIHDLSIASELAVKPLQFAEIAAGKAASSERKIRRKDGTIIDVEISARIIAPDRFLAFVRDISERKKAEQELIKSREDLRKLGNYIENIREEERLKISREIHDELGQQLAVLKIDIARLGEKISGDKEMAPPGISHLLESVSDMVETVRKISFALRPGLLDDIGLIATLDWYCNDFSSSTGIKTHFTSGVPDDKFPKHLNVGLFRILQESLSNVARHSGAKETHVTIKWQDKQLILLIEDDGKGFDASVIDDNSTLGIMGMKERAIMIGGTYHVVSVPGKGTRIEVKIPLTNPELAETSGSL
ncbi:MAG: PAS domain S-box protein [Bacteroidota bacterium]|nr:PAS domain S-box protein [Bacteroidota bacterium]